jgi:hypothetical protein
MGAFCVHALSEAPVRQRAICLLVCYECVKSVYTHTCLIRAQGCPVTAIAFISTLGNLISWRPVRCNVSVVLQCLAYSRAGLPGGCVTSYSRA